jgi:uncharacterized protein YqeY
MTLVEKLKQDQLNARKEGDTAKASNLTFLLGQLSQKKTPTDQDAIDLIRATVKSTKAAYKDELPTSVSYDIQIMESYLPSELTDDEIYTFLDSARDSGDKITKAYMGKINLFAKAQGKIVNNANASLILQAYI